jgi:hypothetical protein
MPRRLGQWPFDNRLAALRGAQHALGLRLHHHSNVTVDTDGAELSITYAGEAKSVAHERGLIASSNM